MTSSRHAVGSLSEVDPQFAAMCEVLFGKAVEPEEVWRYVYTPDGVSKMLEDASSTGVAKAGPDQADVATMGQPLRGRLRPTGGPSSAVSSRPKVMVRNKRGGYTTLAFPDKQSRKRWLLAKQKEQHPKAYAASVGKSDSTDVVWAGEFAKMDDDKHEVFGWASIVSVGGEPVVDRQGDLIDPEDIEKAAYKYVLENRRGGHQHKRVGEEPFHASDLIESFVLTPEKVEKMGLPEDTPLGWWVGYKVHDDETWSKIKKGDVTGFSIHGKGKRVPIGA